MRLKQLLAASLLALGLYFGAAKTQAGQMPPAQLAAKLGISVQQLQSLEARFSLSDEQLLGLAQYQLQLMLEDLEHPGVAKHEGEQNFQMLKLRDEHGRIAPDGLMRALEHRRHSEIDPDLFPGLPDPSPIGPNSGTPGPQLAGITSGGWTWLGPGNIGGRVRSILIHPTSTNILWCGGVDGGVWKSTNSGVAWYPLNDFMANLAIASMAMDPANPNVIYAGTGEPMYNADSIRGAGIFKTTDGGTTWTQLRSTTNSAFQFVARLAVDPNNSQIVLAATRSGIYRSPDAGTNWSSRLAVEMLDVQYHPTDSLQAIASTYGGKAYYSTDGGVSWNLATGLPSVSGFVVGRVEVAYARGTPSVVYASMDNSSGQIYASSDGGQSYSLRGTGYNYLGGQGWYDNVIWVDPTSANLVVVGGIDLWRSTDGGATLTRISQWQSAPNSAHADHHAIVPVPNYDGVGIKTVYFGNDGGVYRAADVTTVTLVSGWQELNNNLGITQFYGGAGNAGNGTVVGGTQDNGSLRYTPGGGAEGWTTMFGGDGGFSAADPADPNYCYGEYVRLQIHRSVNGGLSSSYIYSGIADAGTTAANFIAPFILDPNNANTMLAGGSQLWRSSNVKAATPAWSSIKPSVSSPISAIAVAQGNSDIIWIGHNNGNVYSTANGTAATPAWVQQDLGSPNLPNRYCERIAITPGNPNKVYVTFGGYNAGNVWRTLDGGATWTDISGNLPAAPVNCLVLAPSVTNTLYVATEVGVFGSTTDGTTWSTGNDGPANVSVDELFWMSNKLVAVTHGRGMWSITPALGDANIVVAGSTIAGGNGDGQVDPNECNQLRIVLQNLGGAAATNLSGVLTSATPGLTIVQGSSAFPNLASASSGSNATPFIVSTAPGFVCGTVVAVNLVLSYNSTNTVIPLTLPSNGSGYTLSTTTGAALVPGTTDIGNHADDGVTTISLPFTYSFYGHNFISAALSSNGNLQFSSADNAYNNVCLPYAGFNYAIVPLWDDLRTDGAGSGIFTSTSGSPPNRIFNVEWRAAYFATGLPVNFEIRLYEGQPRFDIIYATVNGTGSTVTSGIQSDTGSSYYNFSCNSSGLSDSLQLTFQQGCSDGGGACVVSPPVLIPTASGGNLLLSFSTDVGRTYILQYKNVLDGSPWLNWQTNAGDGSLQTITTSTASPSQRFYRLNVTTP